LGAEAPALLDHVAELRKAKFGTDETGPAKKVPLELATRPIRQKLIAEYLDALIKARDRKSGAAAANTVDEANQTMNRIEAIARRGHNVDALKREYLMNEGLSATEADAALAAAKDGNPYKTLYEEMETLFTTRRTGSVSVVRKTILQAVRM